jgi:hypothetical protein
MIVFIFILSVFTEVAEYQLPLYSVCEDQCYTVNGYIAVTAKHIYVHVNGENDMYVIENKIRSGGKVFYKISNGWFVYTVNRGVLEQGRITIRYRFQNKMRFK